jgi:TusA-related sulfurtransferase
MSTAEPVKIDARGMMCPRPIIELAKARRRAADEAVVEVTADDLAFESDVRAWCEATGSDLIDLNKTGDVVVARIQLNPCT